MKDLRVIRVRKIFSNKRHNAFTSLASFKNSNYLAFRSATSHKSYDGKIIILNSCDGETWNVSRKIVSGTSDLRDPRLISFKKSLWLYCFARLAEGRYENFFCCSDDGSDFGKLKKPEGIPSDYILWGFKAHKNKLYASGYTHTFKKGDNFFHASLFKSDNGVKWEKILDFPSPGTETPIDFDKEGNLWALSRDDNFINNIPAMYKIRPPYNKISDDSRSRVPERIHGPMLKRLDGGAVIIARRWDVPGRHNLRTDVFILEDERDIRFVCTLPSGGDTSYASWLDVKKGKAIVSYYSSHEYKMDDPHDLDDKNDLSAEHSTPADIYIADISYDF